MLRRRHLNPWSTNHHPGFDGEFNFKVVKHIGDTSIDGVVACTTSIPIIVFVFQSKENNTLHQDWTRTLNVKVKGHMHDNSADGGKACYTFVTGVKQCLEV